MCSNCEEEDSAIDVLCSLSLRRLQFLLNRWLHEKELGEKWASHAWRFFRFHRFFLFCTNTNSRPHKSFCRKKDLNSLFRNNRGPEGKAVWALGGDSCSESPHRLLNLIVSGSWGGPLQDSLHHHSDCFLAFAEETFLDESLTSINTFSQSLLMRRHLPT